MFWDWIGYIRVEYPSKNTDGFYQMALLRRIFKKKKKAKNGQKCTLLHWVTQKEIITTKLYRCKSLKQLNLNQKN